MSHKLAVKLRTSICIIGAATGVWYGYNILHRQIDSYRELFIIIPICGIAGWLLGSFSNAIIRPKWIVCNYLSHLAIGAVVGYILMVMIYALIPLAMPPDLKKTAWIFWIPSALAFIIGAVNSAEASVGKYHP